MIKKRIKNLRKLMKENNIQAYIIPSTDPHQSEYIPRIWKRREWISGFTGSAGDLAVTMDKVGLWTDSRYFLQAEQQLKGTGIKLFKMRLPETPDIFSWIKQELKKNDTVGIDPELLSYNTVFALKSLLKNKGIEVKSIENNLVDFIWEDQPEFPMDKIKVHDLKYAGESVKSKLNRIRQKMDELEVDTHVITMLDAIAWTFNIRCNDVDFNPVTISYAIVNRNKAKLFVKLDKVTKKVKDHLNKIVEIYDYKELKKHLAFLRKEKNKVLLDSETISQSVVDCLKQGCELIYGESPITLLKAIKNKTELNGFKKAHIRDGVAMIKFLFWLEQSVTCGGVTEISVSDKLESFRKKQALFEGLSFTTIAAYKDHAAIIHYEPTSETDVELKPDGLFLLDSGAQYRDGTTDITRTIAIGKPTDEEKDRFTRVLKGHIDLALTSFPRGTVGKQLDTIARKPLWDVRLNYGHGTGHGVGSFLGVHEAPPAISFYRCRGIPLEIGMVSSNEPGYYKAEKFGIRIENIIFVIKDNEHSPDELEFYKFENLTLCPIDLRLIEPELLTKREIDYLNNYHKKVFKTISPYLNSEEKKWLKNSTNPGNLFI